MKAIKFIMVICLIVSCAGTPKERVIDSGSASVEVLNKIEFIQLQLKELKNGKPANFNDVNEIVNLSKIVPDSQSHNFFGTNYTPTEKNVSQWFEWFNLNKDLLSYYDNKDINKYYYQDKKKIIKIEYEPNKFRYSVSETELMKIAETTEAIKKRSVGMN